MAHNTSELIHHFSRLPHLTIKDMYIRSLYHTLWMASGTVISGFYSNVCPKSLLRYPSTCLKFLCQHLGFEHHAVLSVAL